MAPASRRTPPPALKRLGQHFLDDPRLLARLADALELRAHETVVEIGPGRGSLTDVLRERAARVVAVEIDRALVHHLEERFAGDARVAVVHADVLRTPLAALAGGPFALAGNIPYNITTPILFHALEPPRPTRAVFLVQREVAERLVAEPGTAAYGALTVNLRALARVERLFAIPAGAFHPPPRVDSTVVRVTPLAAPLVAAGLEPRFRAFTTALFALRRKQLLRALRTMTGLEADRVAGMLEHAGVSREARAETLSPRELVSLLRALDAAAPGWSTPG